MSVTFRCTTSLARKPAPYATDSAALALRLVAAERSCATSLALNTVGNFCGAPIMIDTATQEIYYTPIYFVLAQISQTIRPGDRALQTRREFDGLDPDALHACATINDDALLSVQLRNTTKQPIPYKLQLGDRYADIMIPANSVQTVRVQL